MLDRKVFQQIMVRTGLQRLQDNINFLRSVPLLQNLSNEVLAKIADVLEVVGACRLCCLQIVRTIKIFN